MHYSVSPLREGLNEKSTILACLRETAGWTQEALAADLHIPVSRLHRYETTEEPSWTFIYQAAAEMELPSSAVYEMRVLCHQLQIPLGRDKYLVKDYDFSATKTRWLVDAVPRTSGLRLALPPYLGPPPPQDEARAEAIEREREEARTLWAPHGSQSPYEWIDLPDQDDKLLSWAVCELLCHDSARLVSRHEDTDKREVVEDWAPEALGEVALRIACRLAALGDDRWLHRLFEYIWAHIGNFRRVCRRLEKAEEAFHYADEHFVLGATAHPGPLDGSRPYLLKARLCRDQERYDEALALLQRAEPLARPDDPAPHVLHAEIDLRRGDLPRSIHRLDQALPLLAHPEQRAGSRLQRKAIRVAFELAVLRVEAGQIAEAAAQLEQWMPLLDTSRVSRDSIVMPKLFLKLARQSSLDGDRARQLWKEFLSLNHIPLQPKGRKRK
jgi:tetratricopeptide (TPR) repeat protein